MEDGDDELIALVARGDGAAFSRLVSRYRARLTGMTTRIVGNRAVAEEIVQETFARAWINAPKWRPQGRGRSSLAGWLGRVATNLAIDHTRRVRAVPLEDAAEPVDTTPAADEGLIAAEDRKKLEEALAQLPPRQRAAIALTYDQGLTNAQSAEAMEISVGAFELLLVRARRTLRRAMMEDKAQ